MSNPFSDIPWSSLELLHYQAIESLIDGLSVPCRISYGVTTYEDCPSCLAIGIGNKNSNVHLGGSRVPFHSMSGCVNCNGTSKIPVETTENINLCVIWDYKKFVNFNPLVNNPNGLVQTLSRAEGTLPQIKSAKHIIIDTNLEAFVSHKFVRDSEPNPLGFGASDFISVLWRRA